ncbi:MAG: hypothetical protein FWC85_00935 [Elusimicrobia bacterium]|nr:hypothetical protein [Elusimicrobiota bacterium]
MKKIIITAIFLCLACTFAFGSVRQQTLLNNARTAYEEGRYQRAIELYESLIRYDNIRNSAVFYNLASAYYRDGNLGKAMLNIMRAFNLNPRNSDIRYNMRYMRHQTLEPEVPFAQAMVNWVINWGTLNEFTVIALLSGLFLCLFTGLLLLKQEKKYKKPALVALVIFFITGFLFFAKADYGYFRSQAIAIERLEVFEEPSTQSAFAFAINEGRQVTVLSRAGGWSLVRLDVEGIAGWAENANIEII